MIENRKGNVKKGIKLLILIFFLEYIYSKRVQAIPLLLLALNILDRETQFYLNLLWLPWVVITVVINKRNMVDIPGTEAIVFHVFFRVCICCLWRCKCMLACRNQISTLGVEARDQSWLLLRNHLPHLFFQIRFCTGIWGLPVRLG